MPNKPDLPCADCGRMMWRGPGSLPAGQARCRACRSARVTASAPSCPGCGKALTRYARGARRCSDCAHTTPPRPRPTASERGYGTKHQRLRRILLPQFIGRNCAVCGEVMREGQALDLDHSTPLRVDPDSVADRVLHRACNAAWNRRGKPTGFDYSPRPCEVCGTSFKPKLTTQSSCSRACGVIVRRRRQAVA